MNIFKRTKTNDSKPTSNSALAEIALNSIHDGVIITDKNGIIKYINPAAAQMTGSSASHSVGLDYGLVIKLESKEGRELLDRENPLIQAMTTGQALAPTDASLIVGQSNQRLPIAISVQIANDSSANRIITFRDISKELEEEGEQTEFISTASHEMRTPVATIDGYLSLSLNPQTATIDDRARGYLTAAEKASKHLGKLFQDLLDVTKLDDGRIKAHFTPVEMIELIKGISDDYAERAKNAKLTYNFGSSEPVSFGNNRRMEQVVYGYVDVDFMREIMDNLIENAIKYTPVGGSIYVNVRGDGDRVLINVTDTGIGISAEDLGHIFQKFYRVDNSDTRTIGGTGLGLYLVKQRAEAMGGKVWAESAFGEGSTFYVSLPRLTNEEYEKRMIVVQNQQIMNAASQPATAPQPPVMPQPNPVSQPTPMPQTTTPVQAAGQVSSQPFAQSAPLPVPPVAPEPITQPVPQPVIQSTPPVSPQPVIAQPAPHQPVAKPAPVQVASQSLPTQLPPVQPVNIATQPVPRPVAPTQPSVPAQPVTQPVARPSVTAPITPAQPIAPSVPPASAPPASIPPAPQPIAPPGATQPVSDINNKLNGENK
ncbi:PAS domain-containing protein [Candidatus Saccharibacteria bacterium]|nr:PAS domain-containing protein [Candidatus Saccharibacteria bacterium]